MACMCRACCLLQCSLREPLEEWEVIRKARHVHHRGVGVAVDEARQQDMLAKILLLVTSVWIRYEIGCCSRTSHGLFTVSAASYLARASAVGSTSTMRRSFTTTEW